MASWLVGSPRWLASLETEPTRPGAAEIQCCVDVTLGWEAQAYKLRDSSVLRTDPYLPRYLSRYLCR